MEKRFHRLRAGSLAICIAALYISLTIGVLVPSDAMAGKTIYVGPTRECKTIKQGIWKASSFDIDRIVIDPGIYKGEGNVGVTIDKSVNIYGSNSHPFTVIDGEVPFGEGDDKYVIGIRITASGTIQGISIRNCNLGVEVTGGTDSMFCDLGVTIYNCTSNWRTDYTAGVLVKRGGVSLGGSILNNIGTGMTVELIGYEKFPRTSLRKCVFSLNASPKYGGAIRYRSDLSILDIEGCSFYNNTSPNGGAIYVERAKSVKICNTNFEFNSAKYCGAIYGSEYIDTDSGIYFNRNHSDYDNYKCMESTSK